MLTKKDTESYYILPDEKGRMRSGRNFREDTFDVPQKLIDSPEIKAALDLVTNKYLFYLLAADPECKESIAHKYNHTNDVVRVMLLIHEDSEGYNLIKAVCLALLHDIARPIQGALHNKYSDKSTGIEHGNIGAEIVAKSFPDDDILIQGVKDHNKLDPEHDTPWVYEIRDADRIATYIRIFDRAGAESHKHGEGTAITDEVITAFYNGELVDRRFVVSETDDWICSLAWIWDFKIQKARILLAQDGLPERIVEYIMANFKPSIEEVALLQRGVKQWYAQYRLDLLFGVPQFRKIEANKTPSKVEKL